MASKRRKNASLRKMKEMEEHCEHVSDDNEVAAKNRDDVDTDRWSCEEKFFRDSFYERLIMLNESSGLSLVFNFRETKLDLYLVYKEVIQRGGAYEVSRTGKWNEVASVVSIKSHVSILPSQIQNLYEILLFLYEQIHHYRTPRAVFGKRKSRDSSSEDDDQAEQGNFKRGNLVFQEVPLCVDLRSPEEIQAEKGKFSAPNFQSPKGKRKSCGSSSEDDQAQKCKCKKGNLVPGEVRQRVGSREEDQAEKGKCSAPNSQAPRGPGRPKTVIRDPAAPLTARTGYQLFLKMECERLKKIHGETDANCKVRDMAIEAWRQLSKNDRLPYVEASRRDKERFDREMAIYMQNNQNNKVTMAGDVPPGSTSTSTSAYINFSASPAIYDDYYVTLEGNAGNLRAPAEKPPYESAIEVLKTAKPTDPIFQMNWDGCCDSPATPH